MDALNWDNADKIYIKCQNANDDPLLFSPSSSSSASSSSQWNFHGATWIFLLLMPLSIGEWRRGEGQKKQ
jgi:hypothetical protein